MGHQTGFCSRVFKIFAPLTLALCTAGASQHCAETYVVTGQCINGKSEATLLVDNRTAGEIYLTVEDSDTHAPTYRGAIRSTLDAAGESSLIILTIPSGHWLATAWSYTENRAYPVTPAEFTIGCGKVQNLVIQAKEQQRGPVEISEYLLPTGRLNLPGRTLPGLNECTINPPAPLADLVAYAAFSSSALGAQVLANKAYIEDFFATTFPDLYAEAGGEAIAVEINTAPGLVSDYDGVHAEMLTDVIFTVNSQFRFLNNGIKDAGHFAMAKLSYTDTDGVTPMRVMNFVANPVRRRVFNAFTSYEYQMPTTDLSDPKIETLDYIHFLAPISAGFEFQLAFKKARCHSDEEGAMTPHLRGRLRAGKTFAGSDERSNPFSAWTVINPHLGDCILKEMNKTLRGEYDFLRRKLMDLSGNDTYLFTREPDGSTFSIDYSGTYECSPTVLEGLFRSL